jgi:dTDP-4-dehydrorhamnose reductase
VESDRPNPLGAYGRSKADAEAAVLARLPGALVVRTSAFFGPWDRHNFVARVLDTLRRGEPFPAVSDQIVSPTYVPDLVHVCLDFLQDGERGLWHLANRGSRSWAELAGETARLAGLDESLIIPCMRETWPASRPCYSVLGSERGWPLPAVEDALKRCLASLVFCSTKELRNQQAT